MKRGEVLRHLLANGCRLAREGSSHSIWVNPATGAFQPIPRHTEIHNGLVRKICRLLGVPEIGR